MVSRCPGQDTQFWGPDDIYSIDCPKCGKPMEFFKDDIRRRCRKCGHLFLNPKLDLGCSKWCQYAEQCIGTMSKEEFKEVIVQAIKDYHDGDKERINHSLAVLDFVERILEEEQGNPKVAIAVAALYDIGTQSIGEKQRGRGGLGEKPDSVSPARGILDRSGAGKEVTEAVCRILEARENSRSADILEHRIVHDARRLAMLRDDSIAMSIFLTPTGRKIAEGFISQK
jgi:Zn ribbon nucleic-acid-binding protein